MKTLIDILSREIKSIKENQMEILEEIIIWNKKLTGWAQKQNGDDKGKSKIWRQSNRNYTVWITENKKKF